MTPGPYKYDFIFDIPGHGFTESHWRTTTQGETLLQCFQIAQELGRRRMVCAGAQCTLQSVRISNAQLDGRKGTSQNEPRLGNPSHGCAASNVALNVKIASNEDDQVKITQWRGFWDDIEITGGAIDRRPDFMAAFNSWAQYYAANKFGWYGRNATTADMPIIGYTVNAAGVVKLSVQGDLTGILAINKPREATITGVNSGKSQVNGQQVVIFTGVQGGISDVLLKFPMALTPFTGIGFIRVFNYTMREGVNLSLSRIGKRQAGAPLLRSRGRGPKRIRV